MMALHEEDILNSLKLFQTIALAFCVYSAFPFTTANADEAACNQCKQSLIDQRWELRKKCLADGGNEDSCNGSIVGPTCCHCTKGPQEDANCWNVTCDTECLWSKQCASSCE
jgi:hypothetical protein